MPAGRLPPSLPVQDFTAFQCPIWAEQAGCGWLPALSELLHCPPPPTSPSSTTAMHACYLHSMGTSLLLPFWVVQETPWLEDASSACCFLTSPWKKADVTHLWELRQLANGPRSSRTCWWLSHVSRKVTSGREAKRKQAGAKGGMACGRRSPGRSENNHIQMPKQSHDDDTWKETRKLN